MKRWQSTTILGLGATAALLVGAGCTKHTVEMKPIKIEPIHMTLDINLKVDRELDKFFDFEDKVAAPTTQPAESAGQDQPLPMVQSSPTLTSPGNAGGLP